MKQMFREEKLHGENEGPEYMLLKYSTPCLNYGCTPAILLYETTCNLEEIYSTYLH